MPINREKVGIRQISITQFFEISCMRSEASSSTEIKNPTPSVDIILNLSHITPAIYFSKPKARFIRKK